MIGGIEGESHNENVRLESISSTHGDGDDGYIELDAGFTIYTMMLKEERLYCAIVGDLSRPIVVSLASK